MFQVKIGATLECQNNQLMHPETRNTLPKGAIIQIDNPDIAQKYIDSGICRLISWIMGDGEIENKMMKQAVEIENKVEIVESEEFIPEKKKNKYCKSCAKKKAKR